MSGKPYVGHKHIGATAIESQQQASVVNCSPKREIVCKKSACSLGNPEIKSQDFQSNCRSNWSKFGYFYDILIADKFGIIKARSIICRVNINSRSRG